MILAPVVQQQQQQPQIQFQVPGGNTPNIQTITQHVTAISHIFLEVSKVLILTSLLPCIRLSESLQFMQLCFDLDNLESKKVTRIMQYIF